MRIMVRDREAVMSAGIGNTMCLKLITDNFGIQPSSDRLMLALITVGYTVATWVTVGLCFCRGARGAR